MSRPEYSVAFFMYDFAGGGVERMRLRLANALAERGHAVTLIVQRRAGPLLAAVPDGIAVRVLDRDSVAGSALALAGVLRAMQPDVLVSSLDHCNIAALCAAALARVPTRIVVCQHNALSAERALGWKYRVVPLLYRLLAPLAAGFVAVSRGVANDLVACTGLKRDRVTVVFNPVFGGGGDSGHCDAPHAWFNGPDPVFVFAGRLVAQKDPQVVLQAFAARLRSGPARLIVLGEGDLLPELQAQAERLSISARVLFAGFRPDPMPWLRHAYALVLPSRYEGFGNVIVEALGCGTPVVAADCPHGPAEILEGGRFGRLVPVGDSAALARAMQSDLRGDFPAHRLRARATAFSVSACADQHEALFARIARKAPSRAFGLRFSRLDARAAADRIVSCGVAGQMRLVVTPNIDHIRLLQRRDFAAAYAAAALTFADGFPVALYAWLRGAAPPRRVTGTDILHDIIRHPGLDSRRVMVIAESVATQVALRDWLLPRGLGERWNVAVAAPALAYDPAAQQRLAASIAAFAPDILVMTLGAPVSEEFVHRLAKELPPCWALCFGQAVRVEIGLIGRAPMFLRSSGLEWLWRVLIEPRRLLPRYLKAAIWFPRAVAADMVQMSH